MAIYKDDQPMLPAYIEGRWVAYGYITETPNYDIKRQEGAMCRFQMGFNKDIWLGVIGGHEDFVIQLSHRRRKLLSLWHAANEAKHGQRFDLDMEEYWEFAASPDPITKPWHLAMGGKQYWVTGKTFVFNCDGSLNIQLQIVCKVPLEEYRVIEAISP